MIDIGELEKGKEYLIHVKDTYWGDYWYVGKWDGKVFLGDVINYMIETVSEKPIPLQEAIEAYRDRQRQ